MSERRTCLEMEAHVKSLELLLSDSAAKIEELEKVKASYDRMLENLKEEFLFYRHDAHGRFTFVSPSYANILGYSPEEYTGKSADECWTSHAINEEANRRTKLSSRGMRQPPYEMEIYHKSGACRRFVTIETPILDTDGNVIAVEGTARDITEKRRIEEQLEKYRKHLEELVRQRTMELQSSQKQLLDIIDFLPDPTYVVDRDEAVIAWNREMASLTGISAKAVIGTNYRRHVNKIHAREGSRQIRAVLGKKLQENGSPRDGGPCHHSIEKQADTLFSEKQIEDLRDGQIGYVWITTAPILDGGGCTVAAIESIRDVTEMKHAEQKIRDSERRLSTLMANLPGMAYRFVREKDGWYAQYVSEGCRQLFGSEPDSVIQRRVSELTAMIHPEDLAALVEKVNQAIETQRPFQCEYRILSATGEIKWVFDKTEIVMNRADGQLSLEGYMADFTLYKEMEERLVNENTLLRSTIRDRYKFKDILGNCQAMQDVYELIVKAAVTEDNVFITGESGTGKELVAKAIHGASKRKNGPFIPVNCAAIPENLIEAEFFGTSRGAFTGAGADKKGYLEAADQGTIFLDEIGDISPSLQVKLLRAIDGGGLSPVGSRRIIHPDIRIIAASNKDVEQMVAAGKMRQDFFFRIHVIPIVLPPLRERGDDVLILINHFLRLYSPSDNLTTLSRDDLEALKNHHWPGNVRELQNVLKRFIALRNLNFLKVDHRSTVARSVSAPAPMRDDQTFKEALGQVEKELILKMLSQARWNKTKTASLLGVSRKTLFRKMKACGLI
jgi:PAS domain S-box-containing protein